MFCSQLSEYFPVSQAQLTNFSCSALIVLDVSHFNSCILKNTSKIYFLLPARRLVCAVPAVQELQPLLLSGVHPRARHRDQEPAEEVQVDGHPGGNIPPEPDAIAGLAATTWRNDDYQSDQYWQQREDNLAKRRRRYCCVIATVFFRKVSFLRINMVSDHLRGDKLH